MKLTKLNGIGGCYAGPREEFNLVVINEASVEIAAKL